MNHIRDMKRIFPVESKEVFRLVKSAIWISLCFLPQPFAAHSREAGLSPDQVQVLVKLAKKDGKPDLARLTSGAEVALGYGYIVSDPTNGQGTVHAIDTRTPYVGEEACAVDGFILSSITLGDPAVPQLPGSSQERIQELSKWQLWIKEEGHQYIGERRIYRFGFLPDGRLASIRTNVFVSWIEKSGEERWGDFPGDSAVWEIWPNMPKEINPSDPQIVSKLNQAKQFWLSLAKERGHFPEGTRTFQSCTRSAGTRIDQDGFSKEFPSTTPWGNLAVVSHISKTGRMFSHTFQITDITDGIMDPDGMVHALSLKVYRYDTHEKRFLVTMSEPADPAQPLIYYKFTDHSAWVPERKDSRRTMSDSEREGFLRAAEQYLLNPWVGDNRSKLKDARAIATVYKRMRINHETLTNEILATFKQIDKNLDTEQAPPVFWDDR